MNNITPEMITEFVRAEVQTHLQKVVQLLMQDLNDVFTDFDTRIKALEPPVGPAPKDPTESGKEL